MTALGTAARAPHGTRDERLALDALRRRIADVVGDDEGSGDARVLPTGVVALDAALRGGLPRGRITELLGEPGTGKTTLTRRLVARALADGVWVAYVDVTRTLAPRDWATLAAGGTPLWVVRPPIGDVARGAWCADVLLRSGAFGLVVVDGAPALSRAVAVRLLQLARDADAALLLLADGVRASELAGALRLRTERRRAERPHAERPHAERPHAERGCLTVLGGADGAVPRYQGGSPPLHPGSHRAERVHVPIERGAHHPNAPTGRLRRTRHFTVTVEKGGTLRTVEVSCAVDVARRLCAHPEVPDRRDVAGTARRVVPGGSVAGGSVAGGSIASADAGSDVDVAAVRPAALPPVRRARRCAEPILGRDA